MQIPPLPRSSRPRIGIPVRLSGSTDPDPDPRVGEANALFDYIVELVRDGGGEPVLLAAVPAPGELADPDHQALDGVVLPGGGDLDPRLYGEQPGGACYDVNQAQDQLDLGVARQAIDAGLPVLGICRGHQLLNVLYGGTLIQDMTPGPVVHHEPAPVHGAGPWAWHEVEVQPGSKVAALYGSTSGTVTVKIASGHHQAVAQVARGLTVTAVAEDGTIEALEDPDRWVASVQWHPEALELPAAERLAPFRGFVEVCRNSLPR
ncbi:putative glutamine amidotransferase [Arthrobacter sp. V4I6]|uniref:gamma-glutamyl-gamma-aminobutyrate hydrolase family protein n=1 Tax=unclassified Arthrobacter TaxID=235627 RepID=UPI00277EF873|nr:MULTISPECIES: gamma-glutamyl-gamma-aminobutyrate hydrolase family protein [unclassified Arthrobacter]MDQ0822595.1 putative glutamine amidotransferase [Arthrobacter sp. V1I7]MDQ0852223.1 putative glutamine amidotransferase [Arthrobacter sp. V4I6]